MVRCGSEDSFIVRRDDRLRVSCITVLVCTTLRVSAWCPRQEGEGGGVDKGLCDLQVYVAFKQLFCIVKFSLL